MENKNLKTVCSVNTDFSLRKLAEGVKPNSSGEYCVQCPICKKAHDDMGLPYSKRKLYIAKDYSTSYCFVCHTVFLDPNYREEEEERRRRITVADMEKLIHEDSDTMSPTICRVTAHPTPESESYLTSRSPYYSLEEMLRDGFQPDDGRIIIRYFYGDTEYFYQIRYLHPKDGRKYFLPPTGFKPVYLAKGEFNPFSPTIITEGAFSSYCLKLVAPEYNVIAVQGSSMTDGQIHQLEEMGGIMSPTFIFLDETDLSFSLMRKLARSKRFGKLRVIRNDFGKDPEELSRHFQSKEDYKDYIIKSTRLEMC